MVFGTNDSVAASSTAKVTVTNFAIGADSLFYQSESSATNSSIVASATSTTVNGLPSSIVTLPDGTSMTIVGISTGTLAAMNGAGILFKP